MRMNPNGENTAELHLPLPAETQAALEEAGIDAPAEVLLLLREATGRERQAFDAERQTIGVSNPVEWVTRLMMRRAAPDTDERVVRELLNDMTETVIAQIVLAYVTGALADPKALLEAVQGTQMQMTNLLLAQLGAGTLPSSPGSTESPSGTTPTTPPAI